ncbi:type II toxin-antitoxin system RelE/ParE family toxin [Rhizobium sp. FKL33]|uniref:type II toxin-antitoxin system RelE/ParE family toxin n=1 Tax=Rhizobium sp. FKL33 TaxID=2562307 RepID=UPI0010BF9646|nr:type II toxin-antitoxin system RelE/ParE family toxin [Rhizobium sp. FKL33]
MTKIKVSREAADFVRNETACLRRRNKNAAQSFLDAIRRAKTVLATFEDAGNRTHGLQIKDGRTLVVDAYLFDYLLEQGPVQILAIRRGRMPMITPEIDEGDRTQADLSG